MTKLIRCTCKHEFQDATYGQGRRVANAMKSGKSEQEYRCTVCAAKSS